MPFPAIGIIVSQISDPHPEELGLPSVSKDEGQSYRPHGSRRATRSSP
jgi:hypothetical protein